MRKLCPRATLDALALLAFCDTPKWIMLLLLLLLLLLLHIDT